MASAGPNAPGTMANDTAVGTIAWTNADNAKVSDNSYAQNSTATGGTTYSNYLKATNFNFAIPAGSTIDGITVSIEKKRNTQGTYDHVVSLVKDGAVSGDNKAETVTLWPTSDAANNYGGAADLWGNELSVDDVNNSEFGVVLEIRKIKTGKMISIAYVDFISITVTYTESGGGASVVPVLMSQYRQRKL